jgi:DNA adenine methylase
MKTCIICQSQMEGSRRKLCGSLECKQSYDAQKQANYRQRQNRAKRNGLALHFNSDTPTLSGPPVRYFGGKWKIGDWIIEKFPPHCTYVEPFCGAANILFKKHPSRMEIINDLNSNIITFFDMLRSRPDDLLRAIDLTPYSREEHKRAHEEVPLQHKDRELEVARRFYIRSRQSFGSGEGEYSTGWRYQKTDTRGGASVTAEWNRFDHLRAAAQRLKAVQIECDNALKCIERFDTPETLFYVDPPYLFETRYSNEERYAHEMTNQDHRQLAALLRNVEGMVLISGYKSALYDELYGDWRCISKSTTTNGNNEAEEYLWISPRADDVNRLPLFAYQGGAS